MQSGVTGGIKFILRVCPEMAGNLRIRLLEWTMSRDSWSPGSGRECHDRDIHLRRVTSLINLLALRYIFYLTKL
jgi:hypothetical protein